MPNAQIHQKYLWAKHAMLAMPNQSTHSPPVHDPPNPNKFWPHIKMVSKSNSPYVKYIKIHYQK